MAKRREVGARPNAVVDGTRSLPRLRGDMVVRIMQAIWSGETIVYRLLLSRSCCRVPLNRVGRRLGMLLHCICCMQLMYRMYGPHARCAARSDTESVWRGLAAWYCEPEKFDCIVEVLIFARWNVSGICILQAPLFRSRRDCESHRQRRGREIVCGRGSGRLRSALRLGCTWLLQCWSRRMMIDSWPFACESPDIWLIFVMIAAHRMWL